MVFRSFFNEILCFEVHLYSTLIISQYIYASIILQRNPISRASWASCRCVHQARHGDHGQRHRRVVSGARHGSFRRHSRLRYWSWNLPDPPWRVVLSKNRYVFTNCHTCTVQLYWTQLVNGIYLNYFNECIFDFYFNKCTYNEKL